MAEKSYDGNLLTIWQINGVRDKDLVIRHGCILAIGEICLALSQIEDKEPQKHNSDILVQVTQLLHGYPAEFLESFGSDTNRIAICRYIECLSMAKWPAPDSIQKLWLSLLETSLVKKNDDLQVAAATSLGKFSAVYALNEAEIGSLIDKACNTSHGPLSRRGYTLIMGELASPIVEQYSIQILSSLVNALKVYVSMLLSVNHKTYHDCRTT